MLPTSRELAFQKSLKNTRIYIHFPDGKSFQGYCNKKKDDVSMNNGLWGEAAFTTAMSGYEETATDPSFLGQHIIYTTAEVGNYPSSIEVRQSAQVFASSLIARNLSYNQFLAETDVPLISGVDTRALVKYMTSVKDHRAVISLMPTSPQRQTFAQAHYKMNALNLVCNQQPLILRPGERPIVVINYGIKNAIINALLELGFPLVLLPYNATSAEILNYAPRLVFLSNGPGDPRAYQQQVKELKNIFLAAIPIRGICLGHQLLTLALGAEIIKLPFGQRGANHPVMDQVTGEILITSQNHGYASDEQSLVKISKQNLLNRELCITHRSLFDRSVEGMASLDGLLKSVQFHPEAFPGPLDATPFFTEIKDYLNGTVRKIESKNIHPLPQIDKLEKGRCPYQRILLIGSGPIKIGQASEFDYSGTQALKALRELGVSTYLLNSNPATIMTDPEMATQTFIEPITKESVRAIIKACKIQAVISTMGGQTALNTCVELAEEGFFESEGVALLGANVDTIKKTEDRTLFSKEMDILGYHSGKRFVAQTESEALNQAASLVGFPLIIRRDFALGGRGSALVRNLSELKDVFDTDIKFPITLEKSLVGHKEVELEVMVDREKNGVIICSIENVDPCGIHTGDSITVAPAQTISDRCMQQMRTMALTIAKHMGVVAGGANVQFAINPKDENDIVVIEMNPRVSRSSALASKATGYPIAKISALLAVGYTLKEILNDITKVSPVAFEPSLDYVAVKIPIFPFNKFPTSSTILGPQMRSVGEVLALGGSFKEAFLKALRALELGLEIPSLGQLKTTPAEIDREYIKNRLQLSYELSLVAVIEALRLNISKEEIFQWSKISPWFIDQAEAIVQAEQNFKQHTNPFCDRETFVEFKQIGLSDKYLGLLRGLPQGQVLKFRIENNIFPVFKSVDTCSGEFQALTPYFYSTYGQHSDARPLSHSEQSVCVLGSGPNRIGQGIEFDYSCVKACERLEQKNIRSIMINSNPETVSTDYDTSSRLYISPLYSEDLCDIFYSEKPQGIIASFSGQTGIKIREHIEKGFRKDFFNFNFLGPGLDALDQTEDRKLFSTLTHQVELGHTKAMTVRGHKNLINAMSEIGLPVIIRPSYVIGGESMYIFNSPDDIKELPPMLREQLQLSSTEFQVETYLNNALEYDVDLVRDRFGNTVFAVCEHIEYAGVHSGDSGMITPPVVLTAHLYKKMKEITIALADKLAIVGPINFQFAVKEGVIYCIEANPRGSRTLPFLSKAYNVSLPAIATDAMLGEKITSMDRELSKIFCVKQSTFPFDRFVQDNIILGPKMRSTGETMGIDSDKDRAILKSYLGNYPHLLGPGKILLSLSDTHKPTILPYLKFLLKMGLNFYATKGTCEYIRKQGFPCEMVKKIHDKNGKSILDALKDPCLKMVFNTPINQGQSKSEGELIRNTAILYGIPCFTRAENIKAVIESLLGQTEHPTPISLQEIHRIDLEVYKGKYDNDTQQRK